MKWKIHKGGFNESVEKSKSIRMWFTAHYQLLSTWMNTLKSCVCPEFQMKTDMGTEAWALSPDRPSHCCTLPKEHYNLLDLPTALQQPRCAWYDPQNIFIYTYCSFNIYFLIFFGLDTLLYLCLCYFLKVPLGDLKVIT